MELGIGSHNYLLCQIFQLRQQLLENTQSSCLLYQVELHTSIQEMAPSILNICYRLDGNASLLTVPQRGMLHRKELWVIENSML